MTEAEWLACSDPDELLDGISDNVNERRARLYGCACARQLWHFLKPVYRTAIETTERYVDGESTAEALSLAHRVAVDDYLGDRSGDASLDNAATAVASLSNPDRQRAGAATSHAAAAFAFDAENSQVDWNEAYTMATTTQMRLVRDIFGNPFRLVTLDPNWCTSAATALAAQMYDSRDFSAMPILADALEDAGCTNAEILDHCRGPGPHVRGCWVVDLVLGKN
jgi:hypothetical protein